MLNAALVEDGMELAREEDLVCPVILAYVDIGKTLKERSKVIEKEMLDYEAYNRMHIADGIHSKCPCKL